MRVLGAGGGGLGTGAVLGAGDGFLWVPFDTNRHRGNFRVRRVSRNGRFRISFPMPPELGAVTAVSIAGVPRRDDAAADIEVYGSYGPVGAPAGASGGSITGVSYALTAGEMFLVDATSIFAAAVAGDLCGLMVDNDGLAGNVGYLGVAVEYSSQ